MADETKDEVIETEVDEDGLTRWIRDNWPKDAPA